jgi:hypothetical protein
MSLAAAFDKKPGDVALVAIPAAVITSAVPSADGVGRKRSRRDMEAASAPKFNKAGNPAKKPTKDDADRVARTIFVGNVPTSMTAIQVARLFQSHLNEARKAGTLAAATAAVEKAAVGASDDAEEAAPSDVADASAGAAEKSAEELPTKVDAAESYEEQDDADSVDGDAKEAGDGASAPRKHRNLTPDVESVRFRSIPVAAVAVAPGADYKTMTKAAFIRKSFADGRDAMNGACAACCCMDGGVQVGGVVDPLTLGGSLAPESVSLQRVIAVATGGIRLAAVEANIRAAGGPAGRDSTLAVSDLSCGRGCLLNRTARVVWERSYCPSDLIQQPLPWCSAAPSVCCAASVYAISSASCVNA